MGVICFSLTLPATSTAVPYFGATIVGLGRAVIAAFIVAIVLLVRKERLPNARQFKSLIIVSFGAVLGFPLLTSWAMTRLPVTHGAIELALLPLATAGFALFRAGERPSFKFWLSSVIGAIAVIIYASFLGLGQLHMADLALLAAVVILGLSYAEGGQLAKELGSWQVIAWAILLAAPFLLSLSFPNFPWKCYMPLLQRGLAYYI